MRNASCHDHDNSLEKAAVERRLLSRDIEGISRANEALPQSVAVFGFTVYDGPCTDGMQVVCSVTSTETFEGLILVCREANQHQYHY